MNATAAESEQTPPLHHSSHAAASQLLLSAAQDEHDESDTNESALLDDDAPGRNDSHAAIKVEDGASGSQDDDGSNATTTTLRPAPQPSIKRRESEAADTATTESSDRPHKKRKREKSPPWQFGSVGQTTLKTADGRRISARFNTNTPGQSESEGLGESASQSAARSRPPSPPWKRFGAEGPTSLQVDGVRKSGRVNRELGDVPKRVSPRQKKQVDKLADEGKSEARPASRGKLPQVDGAAETRPRQNSKTARAVSPSSKIRELQAKIAALQPSRTFASPEAEVESAVTNHKRTEFARRPSSPSSSRKPHRMSNASLSPMTTRPSPRIKLRFSGTRQHLPPPHPQSVSSPPARPPKLSLYQIIEPYELQEMQQPYMENERGPPGPEFFASKNERLALEEADMRKRLVKAALPGGTLSEEECAIYRDEKQEEPAQQHGYSDHLVAHALYFRSLQLREKNQHRIMARKVAYEALEYWKALRGPTEDDIRAEQDKIFRLIYKQVVLDVRAKWEMVHVHVQHLRKERWEAEEDARRQERLQKQLEQAEAMIAKQRGDEDDSDVDMAEDSTGDVAGSETGDEGEDDSEEENMSESESDGVSEADEGGDLDDQALADYMKHRQAEPPVKDAVGDGGDDVVVPDRQKDPPATTRLPAAGTNDGVADNAIDDTGQTPPATAAAAAAAATANAFKLGKANHSGHANACVDQDRSDLRGDTGTETAALLGHEEDEGAGDEAEDEEDDFEPANDADEEDAVSTSARGSSSQITKARRSTRRSPSRDVEMAEAESGLDLSDDESTDMNDSDEDMSSTGDENEAGSGDEGSDSDEAEEQAQSSVLGFFLQPKQIKEAIGLPTPTTSAEGEPRDRTAEPVSDDNTDAQAGAAQADGGQRIVELSADHDDETMNVHGPQTQPSSHSVEVAGPESALRSPSPDAHSAVGVKQLVPVPALLRGTLRSYQHAGVDWLASLHRNGTNGILADEMGLGKTIQTIAVLAHLAEQNEIWEPHLVIVPTSVILNWVNEFHKFLPGFRVLGYYGSMEERQIKRRGWVNDPHHENKEKRGYNVIVTSYNVAMQDINAIRNVQWHYLVLDEAHNIRNFNSQRWQVLIRLKTKARLLLTGTPLQNSLTELWSLLTFLTAGDDDPAHGDLEEFLSHWKEPVKEIFDRGVSTLSTEAQKVVDQLHVSLRPFLLRRLKSEVEKDLPKKTESVVVCKLSKRQRQLYQEYMGLASTRASLTKGNAVSAGKVLLSLRRVCNHPDLFDPRPIQTSYAMELSPIEPFAVKESLVRRMLGAESDTPSGLLLVNSEARRMSGLRRSRQLAATKVLSSRVEELETKAPPMADPCSLAGSLALQRVRQRERKLQHLRNCIEHTKAALSDTPVYGADLREFLTIKTGEPYQVKQRGRQPHEIVKQLRAWPVLGHRPFQLEHKADWYLSQQTYLQQDVLSLDRVAENVHDVITRFAFCTPVATAPVLDLAIVPRQQKLLRANDGYPATTDFAHEARSRTSIVFPDSRLLIYDSGKLQRLSKLLRELQAKGSRSLIFTQMTGTLNILEQFLNLLGLPYLRLDGSTPPERRMIYSSEFNRPDSKYQCMILSSRAGGVGLNLTGASSVIFYDLDWNPQMDRQCMDRAHRIGQVRDVEVFKMVSEKTVEENILRRANQKSLLDQMVIQEGHFTTEYQQAAERSSGEDEETGEDDVTAAIERFLGGGEKSANQAIASVEDREDVLAAEAARKEENQDAEEFAERGSSKGRSNAATPGPSTVVEGEDEEDRKGHVDGYMVAWMEQLLEDTAYVPPPVRRLDKHGRDPSHRPKRKR